MLLGIDMEFATIIDTSALKRFMGTYKLVIFFGPCYEYKKSIAEKIEPKIRPFS